MLGLFCRWSLLAVAFAFAYRSLDDPSWWSVLGAFACGGVWWALSRRKARELDGMR